MKAITRCKFVCNSITRTLSSKYNNETKSYTTAPLDTANMTVVSGDSAENKEFFASTPSGRLEVGLHAVGVFEVGKQYYIDITLAE